MSLTPRAAGKLMLYPTSPIFWIIVIERSLYAPLVVTVDKDFFSIIQFDHDPRRTHLRRTFVRNYDRALVCDHPASHY